MQYRRTDGNYKKRSGKQYVSANVSGCKKIEGCSDRTLQYYKVTVEHLLSQIKTSVRKITTEEIRAYLADYQNNSKCSNVTIDNIPDMGLQKKFIEMKEQVDKSKVVVSNTLYYN